MSAGFVFRQGDACVPVVRGMGVVAAFGGEVVKVDPDFQELSEEAWQALLERVREGASPEEMDILRGLRVHVRHPDGRTTVYAHLQAPYPGLKVGSRVHRGDPIGYVGNTGLRGAPPGSSSGLGGGARPERLPLPGPGGEELLRRARAFFGLP